MLVCLFFRSMSKYVPFRNLDSDSRPTVCSMPFHVHVQKEQVPQCRLLLFLSQTINPKLTYTIVM